MQQIRDAPLVMHQDHSESLGLHVAQRINCYKLPRKLPQIRSAQQRHSPDRVILAGIEAVLPSQSLNIIYIMRNQARAALGGFRRLWLALDQALDRLVRQQTILPR
ncbi:hypothetical protein [Stenotrophomonas tumulicola]|nr:hypothetical protein [Stenotrophomonas tumulicola]